MGPLAATSYCLYYATIENNYHYGAILTLFQIRFFRIAAAMNEQTSISMLTSGSGEHPLSLLRKGQQAVIAGMAPAASVEEMTVQMRLRELGFLPGETLRIVAVSFAGSDPIAVRIGATTFALRRFEAAMVHVIPS